MIFKTHTHGRKVVEYINSKNISGVEELKIDVNKSRTISVVETDRKSWRTRSEPGQVGQQLRMALFGAKAGIFKRMEKIMTST